MHGARYTCIPNQYQSHYIHQHLRSREPPGSNQLFYSCTVTCSETRASNEIQQLAVSLAGPRGFAALRLIHAGSFSVVNHLMTRGGRYITLSRLEIGTGSFPCTCTMCQPKPWNKSESPPFGISAPIRFIEFNSMVCALGSELQCIITQMQSYGCRHAVSR